MTEPEKLLRAFEATWPPASTARSGAFTIRDGASGGKRVSAATLSGHFDPEELAPAIAAMKQLGQTPLFQVRHDESGLDDALAKQGFEVIDPVTAYSASPEALCDPELHRLAAIPCSAPLAIQQEIWAEGGIGPARLAVMARAANPKTYLLGRKNDRPAATAFLSCHEDIAVLHALEVRPAQRRQGVARNMMVGAANWAKAQDARTLALLVVTENTAANALYASLGMQAVGGYHYRIAPYRIAS